MEFWLNEDFLKENQVGECFKKQGVFRILMHCAQGS